MTNDYPEPALAPLASGRTSRLTAPSPAAASECRPPVPALEPLAHNIVDESPAQPDSVDEERQVEGTSRALLRLAMRTRTTCANVASG